MKKIDMGQAIAILANVGVIAGIAFLALQLKQNNQLLAIQARADRAMIRRESITRFMFSSELSQAYVKARAGEPLSELEQHYIRLQNDATLIDWQQVFREVDEEALPNTTIPVETWRRVYRTQPNLSDRWSANRLEYDLNFREFMDQEITAP